MLSAGRRRRGVTGGRSGGPGGLGGEDCGSRRGRTFRSGTALSSGLLGCARSRLSENAVLGADVRPRWGGGARGASLFSKQPMEYIVHHIGVDTDV